MRIAYVTTYDAVSSSSAWRAWKGTGYYIAQSLGDQSISVEYIGPLMRKRSLMVKAKDVLYNHLLNNKYRLDREPLILKHYAHQVSRKLSASTDIVFSPGTVAIAYLETKQPIVFWTDATFAGMIDFHPDFSNLCRETIKNGNAVEEMVLNRCALAIYSSEWAARTAIDNYQIAQSKVKVVPFGANIECDRTVDDIENIVESKSQDRCKLLFLGVDWFRKGGDVAVEVARELNKSGLNLELTVVGCHPETEAPLPDFVRSVGFVSKSTPEGRSLINGLLAESHFLILPSRADTFGTASCEANSFGVPCLSTNIGGIPTVIRDGVNGKTFSRDADIAEYCTYISGLLSDYCQYKDLALSSFNEYQSRLNWSVAGQTVKRMLMEIV